VRKALEARLADVRPIMTSPRRFDLAPGEVKTTSPRPRPTLKIELKSGFDLAPIFGRGGGNSSDFEAIHAQNDPNRPRPDLAPRSSKNSHLSTMTSPLAPVYIRGEVGSIDVSVSNNFPNVLDRARSNV
jgi:hypothetical protein